MTGILYAEINILCIIVMVIVAVSVYKSNESVEGRYVFAALTIFCAFMFSADSVWSLADNGVIEKSYNVIYYSNFVYFLFSGFVGFAWYLFAEVLFCMDIRGKKRIIRDSIAVVPAVIIMLLTIVNKWTAAFYYIDENLAYHRGELHIIQEVCGYVYLLYVAYRGVQKLLTEKDPILKRRYSRTMMFLVVPIIASVGQILIGSIPCLCVGSTLAELLIFIYISATEKEALLIEKNKRETGVLQQALSSTLYSYREIYYVTFRDRSLRMVYPNYSSDDEQIFNYDVICRKRMELIPEDENNKGEISQFFELNRARVELMKHESIECKFSVYTEFATREWQCATFIVQEKDGEMPISAFLTIRSIQELLSKEQESKKELEEALAMAESANKAKSAFLNNMSHDIRTPMNAILGFADMAKKEKDSKGHLDEYLGKISKSGKHLLNLINDILDMSSIESGKVKFNHQVVSIKDIGDGIYDMFTTVAQQKNITFTADYCDLENEYIYCDELRAKQVGVNIVSNAFKYTPDGGNVSMTVRQLDLNRAGFAKYEFKISDDGIGMSPEFKEQLFDSFSRERSATLSGIQGTGLGMAIVKKIVDMVDGEIEVDSAIGEGTTITIRLAIKVADKEDVIKIKEDPFDYSFKGRRVLLVEDNELNREIAEAILEEVGIDVECAVNGLEAVERMEKAQPGDFDMILMDIQMPVMDGYTATSKIRELPDARVAYIPIAAMTANAFEEDKRETMNMGMNGHIAKPIDIEDMLATMKKCMGI